MHFQQRQRTLCVQKAWKTPKNLLVLLEFSDGGLRSLQRRRESARYLLVVATSIYILLLLVLLYVLSLQLTAAYYDQNEQKYEKMRNLKKLLSNALMFA